MKIIIITEINHKTFISIKKHYPNFFPQNSLYHIINIFDKKSRACGYGTLFAIGFYCL